MKTLAIIIGTMLAVFVLTIAAFAIVFYINASEEEFSRAQVIPHPGLRMLETRCVHVQGSLEVLVCN